MHKTFEHLKQDTRTPRPPPPVVSLDTDQPNSTARERERGREIPCTSVRFRARTMSLGLELPTVVSLGTDQPNNAVPGRHGPHSVWNYGPWWPWTQINPATPPRRTIFCNRPGIADRGVLGHRPTRQHRSWAPWSSLGLELPTVVQKPDLTLPGRGWAPCFRPESTLATATKVAPNCPRTPPGATTRP